MPTTELWRKALLVICVGVATSAAARAEPALANVAFQPHRAVYELSLARSAAGTGVSTLSGRIVYEMTGSACEGYTQNMRFVTVTGNQEGESELSDLRTSSWEEVPAKRLRFSSTTYRNEQVSDQSQGTATRKALDGPITTDVVRPAKKKLDIKAGVYFPIQHSLAVIAAARVGQRILSADLYDGSEGGQKLYATTAAIGRQVAPGARRQLAQLANGVDLDRIPSWPISIGYFEPGAQRKDVVPNYEMSYRFHENGVTSSLLIDHGEFAIRGELKELTYLPANPCEPKKPQ